MIKTDQELIKELQAKVDYYTSIDNHLNDISFNRSYAQFEDDIKDLRIVELTDYLKVIKQAQNEYKQLEKIIIKKILSD